MNDFGDYEPVTEQTRHEETVELLHKIIELLEIIHDELVIANL